MGKRGLFITFEGIDGTGKTTQLRLLVSYLRERGHKVLLTREPGGTRLGEQIRKILLSSRTQEMTPFAELGLFYAARAQHLDQVIRPGLAQGMLVISDRYNDASFAYQGFGRKLGFDAVKRIDELVCGLTQPQLTILLDAPPRATLDRALEREGNSGRSRFEDQGLAFHERVRRGYLEIARRDPKRVKVIRADRIVKAVQAEIRSVVDEFLTEHAEAFSGQQSAVSKKNKDREVKAEG
ncbi:MAG: dTMP kinase [Terriglobia bacterium]